MNKRIIGLVVVFIVLAAGLAYLVQMTNVYETLRQNEGHTVTPSASSTSPVVSAPTSTPATSGAIVFTSRDKVTAVSFPAKAMNDGLITIDNPTMLNGTTTAFEQTFSWKLVDARGTVVAEHSAMTHAADAGIPGPFSVTMFYDKVPTTERGTLTVYEASAKDGSPIHDVSIPVVFAKTLAQGCGVNVNVAFVETKGAHLDCSQTKTVTRTVCADAGSAGDVALYELLKGPTAREKAGGVGTELPLVIQYPARDVLGISGQFINYNFGYELAAGIAGSCRVAAIRAQITNTVLSNSVQTGGDGIVIGVNGRTEDILQP